MSCEKILTAILDAVHDTDPIHLRKVELLEMRRRVIELASSALAVGSSVNVEIRDVDPDYMLGVGLVLGYAGRNRFMLDLQRSMHVYGGLTDRQALAVTCPPDENQEGEMRTLGVDPSGVLYRFQAQDVLNEARAKARELAKQPKTKEEHHEADK